jgi:hypothetical protein
MTLPLSPDDRPDPADPHAVRARVPDHVARGVFSTGVIVMTAPTEFVIDFIQNLGRPHQVVARVIMPHPVLPQFVDALLKNIDLYRGRYGNLPQPNLSGMMVTSASGSVPAPNAQNPLQSLPKSPNSPEQQLGVTESTVGVDVGPGIAANNPAGAPGVGTQAAGSMQAGGGPGGSQPGGGTPGSQPQGTGSNSGGAGTGPGAAGFTPEQVPPQNLRRASAQEIYDDLKLRDEILSGSYANAVMIGHGPHEFSFDFITNFYPHSAVSARVFLAAGQVARLAESLRGAWDQIRNRFQPPPGSDSPPQNL